MWRLGDELVSSGAKAVEYLEAGAPLFEELGDNEAALDVHFRLTVYLSTNNVGEIDVRRAMPHFKKAEALLAQQPESDRHAEFYNSMAAACAWTQRIGDGVAAAKRGMEIPFRFLQKPRSDALAPFTGFDEQFLHLGFQIVLGHEGREPDDPAADLGHKRRCQKLSRKFVAAKGQQHLPRVVSPRQRGA